MPNLACPVTPSAFLVDLLYLNQIVGILLGPVAGQVRIAGNRGTRIEGRWGNLQYTADRLDPEHLSVICDESRSFAKWAVELRLGKICRRLLQNLICLAQFAVLSFEFLDACLLFAAGTRALTSNPGPPARATLVKCLANSQALAQSHNMPRYRCCNQAADRGKAEPHVRGIRRCISGFASSCPWGPSS